MASDQQVFDEVRERGLEKDVAEGMDEEALVDVVKAKGILPIFEARPVRLIHELRRQARGMSIQTYYPDDKKRALPHSSDEVGADVLDTNPNPYETRQVKKGKFMTTHFSPKSITDYRL